jgi:hypothetical protein
VRPRPCESQRNEQRTKFTVKRTTLSSGKSGVLQLVATTGSRTSQLVDTLAQLRDRVAAVCADAARDKACQLDCVLL